MNEVWDIRWGHNVHSFVQKYTFVIVNPNSQKSGSEGESGGTSNIILAALFCNLFILSICDLGTFPQIVRH